MATSNVSLKGTPTDAVQTFTKAVHDLDGTIFTVIPGQPLRFNLTRRFKWQSRLYKAANFDGTARLTQAGPDQTRVDIDLNPSQKDYITLGAICLVAAVFNSLWIYYIWSFFLFIVVGGLSVYQTTVWAGEMMEGLLSNLSQSPAFTVAASAPPPFAPAPSAPPPFTSTPLPPPPFPTAASVPPPLAPAASPQAAAQSSVIAGQLVQLAELHKAGILTDDEFDRKKTELLKRM